MKLALIGLSGSGKTTYLILLHGMIADRDRFIPIEPALPDIEKMLRRFRFLEMAAEGVYSARFLLNQINKTWMVGKGTMKTITHGQLKRYLMRISVPIYRNEKAPPIHIKLDVLDPTGDALTLLERVFERVDSEIGLDPKKTRETVINELDKRVKTEKNKEMSSWAKELLQLLQTTDYDGFLIFIDPLKSKKTDIQPTLYSLLKVLVNAQKKSQLTLSVVFSKAIARGFIDLSGIDIHRMPMEFYEENIYWNALDRLEAYGMISMLITDLLCAKKKIKFAGAFFYDAFISADGENPRPKRMEDGTLYIESLTPYLPLIHTIHVHYNKRSFLNYADIVQRFCI